MKILLVRPTYGSRFQITPPLSLGYLSASLKKNDYRDVSLLDGSLDDLSPAQAVKKTVDIDSPTIIGIQVYTGAQNWVRDYVAEIKVELPKAVVVVGGPHVTALKENALAFMGVDYGVVGEGENAIVQFVRYVDGQLQDINMVEGLIYNNFGVYKKSLKEYGFVSDANIIESPDWDLLKPERYFQYMQGASVPLKGKRPVPILTSRGCPYKCTFCSSSAVNRGKMRYRSPESIIKEIKYLIDNYGVDELFIADDNFTMNVHRAESILDLIIESKLRIHWRAPNGIRIDRINENLIKKIKQSGCYYVGVGVESGSKRILRLIQKDLDLEIVRQNVALLSRNGVMVSGFFMCGLMGEEVEDVERSIRYALSVKFDRIQVSDYVPYPGSFDFDKIFGIEDEVDYQMKIMKFQKDEFVPDFRSLTLNEVIELQRKFIFGFYLRPYVLWSILKSIRLSQISAILRHPYIRRWYAKKKTWFAE